MDTQLATWLRKMTSCLLLLVSNSSLCSCVGFWGKSGSGSASCRIRCGLVSSACYWLYLPSGRKWPSASSLYNQARSSVFYTSKFCSVSPLVGNFSGGCILATGILAVLLFCTKYYTTYCTILRHSMTCYTVLCTVLYCTVCCFTFCTLPIILCTVVYLVLLTVCTLIF